MNLFDRIHEVYFYDRRIHILAKLLAELIPPEAHVLDVGCGDGLLSNQIQQIRTDCTIKGIDVLLRDRTHIPVKPFDGIHIPYADREFDAVIFVDVLHHTEDPTILLHEACRVVKRYLIIKDHLLEGPLAAATLKFMDWVGNFRYGVDLPYNYWSEDRWHEAFTETNLRIIKQVKKLKLFPWFTSWIFDRSLHFIAILEVDL